MQNNKTFYKKCSTREQAVDFAENPRELYRKTAVL